MATKVAGELYIGITRQLFEIGRQLNQLSGYPFDSEALRRHLQVAIEGRFDVVGSAIIRPSFHRDMRKEGLELVEAGPSVPKGLRVSDMELVSFHNAGESLISGNIMQARAKELDANFGQAHAEFLIEHQSDISAEYRGNYLVFPATIWLDGDGDLGVPCLHWIGGRWCLGFDWRKGGWSSGGRLVRFRKSR